MPAQLLLLAYKTLGHIGIVLTGAGVFAAVDFTHTVTLGSVLIIIAGSAIALIYTARSKVARVWRDERDGERAAKERAQEELAEERASRAVFEHEQQELRHDLKNEIVACKAQLKVMEAKTDLTAALDAIRAMNEQTADAVVTAMHKTSLLSEQRDGKTQVLLEEIRDKLPGEPIAVVDVTPHESTTD